MACYRRYVWRGCLTRYGTSNHGDMYCCWVLCWEWSGQYGTSSSWYVNVSPPQYRGKVRWSVLKFRQGYQPIRIDSLCDVSPLNRVGVVEWWRELCCGMFSRSWVWTPTNACGYMIDKYVDQNGLIAMLATNRSAGVAPEVNLRNPLHTGDKTYKGDVIRSPKQGYQAPQKGLVSYKFFV